MYNSTLVYCSICPKVLVLTILVICARTLVLTDVLGCAHAHTRRARALTRMQLVHDTHTQATSR